MCVFNVDIFKKVLSELDKVCIDKYCIIYCRTRNN